MSEPHRLLGTSTRLLLAGALCLAPAAFFACSMLSAPSEAAGAGRALLTALFGFPAIALLAAGTIAGVVALGDAPGLRSRAAVGRLAAGAVAVAGVIAWVWSRGASM